MTELTLTEAQAQLSAWLDANKALAAGKSYSIQTATGGRSLTKSSTDEVLKQIKFWRSEVDRLSRTGGGRRMRYGVKA